ncbi:DUF4424 family protein [Zhengella mangrovi]|nr:DUF4424 family protein [Zhengella mangrovi]
MKSTGRICAALALLAGACGTASAYDGPVYEHLGVYGLALGSDRDLAVRANRYVLTPDRLTASLSVENYGKAAVTSRLYLQFKPVTSWHSDNAGAFALDVPDNLLGASATLDGRDLDGTMRESALYRGIDISADLAAAGIGLVPFRIDTSKADPDRLRALREGGIAGRFGADWQLDLTYAWPVTIEAGKTSEVRAVFKPILGAFVDTLTIFDYEPDKLQLGIEGPPVSGLCLTPGQEQRIFALFGAIGGDGPEWPYRIRDYSVTLVAPAQGFAGLYDFSFRIEPSRPGDIVSVCGGDFREQTDGAMVWETDRADETVLTIHFIEVEDAYRRYLPKPEK